MTTANTEYTFQVDSPGILWPEESPRNGIWPRRMTLWLAAIWIMLWIIRPWEIMFPELASLRIPRVFAITMCLAVFLSGQLRGFSHRLQTQAVVLFIVALVVSAINGFSPEHSWTQLYFAFTVVFFYFILLSVIRTPYELTFIVACFIVVMATSLAKSEVEFLFFGNRMTAQGVQRMLGPNLTYKDPNVTAEYAVVSLPFLFFLWKIRHSFSQTWPAIWRRLFPIGLVCHFFVASAAVLFTHSRTGVVGLALCLLMVAASGKRLFATVRALAVTGLFIGVVYLCLPQPYQGRISSLWNSDSGVYSTGGVTGKDLMESRLGGMWIGLEMFDRFPATGVGLGNFAPYRFANIDGDAHVAHSLIGQTAGETGLFGSATFVLLVLAIFYNCRRTQRLTKLDPHPQARLLLHLAAACQQSILLCLLFGTSLHNLLRFHWFWVAAFALLARTFAEMASSLQHDVVPAAIEEAVIRPRPKQQL